MSHDDRVIPCADRVLYLEDGRLRQPDGQPDGAGHAGVSARALAPNQAG